MMEIIGALAGGVIMAVVLWKIVRGGVPEDSGDYELPRHDIWPGD